MAKHRHQPIVGLGISGRHRNGIREVRTIIKVLQAEFANKMSAGEFKISIGPIHHNGRRGKPAIRRNGKSLVIKIKGRAGGQSVIVWSSRHLWTSVERAVRRTWRKRRW